LCTQLDKRGKKKQQKTGRSGTFTGGDYGLAGEGGVVIWALAYSILF